MTEDIRKFRYTPCFTYFYGGVLSRSRIDSEAKRLNRFCRTQVDNGLVTEDVYAAWKEGLEDWRVSWHEKIS